MPDSTLDTYAAKTQLSKLLARVEQGETITITRRGVPVARLVPATPEPAVRFGLLKHRLGDLAALAATPEDIADFEDGPLFPEGA